ncbi:MAG: hypothetical protein JST16_15655 [Bdellovibrionales bacterium]|nr:hypothetical protein [Bdellovibrionales bacterium]
MAIYAINFDLNTPGQAYESLHSAIRSLGAWIKPMKSSYLVQSSMSANAISDALKSHLDKNDYLLVNEFPTSNYQGWMNKDVWAWINSHRSEANAYR